MKAREFDRAFHSGEDVDALVDWSAARRPTSKPAASTSTSPPGWWKASTAKHDGSA